MIRGRRANYNPPVTCDRPASSFGGLAQRAECFMPSRGERATTCDERAMLERLISWQAEL